MSTGWTFWIDRGGTFTDAIGVAPDGALHTAKRLSADDAPAQLVREMLAAAGAWSPGAPLPRVRVELGTTVATNALLERRGVPTLFVTNAGFGDLLAIGTQERPELFELAIRKPAPLPSAVLEVRGRVGADGSVVEPLDLDAARAGLVAERERGHRSVAIALIHATAFPEMERALAALAREVGFEHVAASHEIANEAATCSKPTSRARAAHRAQCEPRRGRVARPGFHPRRRARSPRAPRWAPARASGSRARTAPAAPGCRSRADRRSPRW